MLSVCEGLAEYTRAAADLPTQTYYELSSTVTRLQRFSATGQSSVCGTAAGRHIMLDVYARWDGVDFAVMLCG